MSWALALNWLPAGLADACVSPALWMLYGDLRRSGRVPLKYGPFRRIRDTAHIPLIDTGAIKLVRSGAVEVCGAVTKFTKTGVSLADGTHRSVDAVVLATGYRTGLENILPNGGSGLIDRNGVPFCNGAQAAAPGLYFCGFTVSPTGVLREIGRQAHAIARAIAASSVHRQAPNSP